MVKSNVDEINRLHRKTYDDAAAEYESRVEKLKPITEQMLDTMTKYLKSGGTILDIGCAVGYIVELMSQKGFTVDGIDISPQMVNYAKIRNPGTNIITGDFLTHQFDDKYDGIIAFAFIHLFPKDYAMKCIKKMIDLLNPGGVIFLTTSKSVKPSEGFENKEDYKNGQIRYRKRWTQKEFEKTIDDLGLNIIKRLYPKDAFGKVWMDYLVQPK